MVKIRLKRFGRKAMPHYRVVAIQARTKRQGESLEDLGHYSPLTKKIVIKQDRVEYWLKLGAQPSETVENLLIKEKMLPAKSYKKTFKMSPKQKSQDRAKAKGEKAEAAKAKTEEKAEAAAE